MIDFATPGYFAIFLLVAAMTAASLWLVRWQRQARQSFAGPQGGRWPAGATWPRLGLVLLAAVLIVIAAARPQWGTNELTRSQEGVDLVIVLDVSQSMQVQDVQPSRFGLARDELVRLVESMRGNRMGLVLFAGSAMLRSPLTSDVQALSELIRHGDLDVGLLRTGSDVGGALQIAGLLLSGSESAGKAVLVVSDGEDHVGSFSQSASQLKADGIAIFSAGVGTAAGGPVPEPGVNRIKVDAAGRPVVSRLQEASLQAIAGEGGYRHLEREGNLADLPGQLSRLEASSFGDQTQRIPIERFQPFIIAALILLAEAWLLPARFLLPTSLRLGRLRPHPGLGLLLVALVVGACGDSNPLREDNADANALYEAGDFEGALQAYEELLAQRPDVPALSYNIGNTLNRLEEYERAVAETLRALPPDDAKLGAQTYYALGNHLFRTDQLALAYQAYRSALLLDPDDMDAKNNLELTLYLLAQSQPQPGGQGDGMTQPEQPNPGQGEAPQQQPGANPSSQPPAQATPAGQPPAPTLRELQEALRGIDDSLTFGEASHILDLFRDQQQRERQGRPTQAPSGPDY